MPVAWYKEGTQTFGPREFPAPKRADLRGWWNACRKALPDAGLGYYAGQKADVQYATIIFDVGHGSELMIARRRGRR